MDGSLWRDVVADLREDHRCVVPTLPLGGHRRPMRADANLSMRAQARLVAEFLERMDLREATLVGNYWGAVTGFRGDRRAGGKAGATTASSGWTPK
jgi:pimeloyl-ACP methyl ester carboxylesterase